MGCEQRFQMTATGRRSIIICPKWQLCPAARDTHAAQSLSGEARLDATHQNQNPELCGSGLAQEISDR